MPRYTSSSRKAYSSLFQAWRDRRSEKEDEHAREVLNAAAGAENALISELDSIDFLHSRLPKDFLLASSDPDRKMGDLEFARLKLINALKTAQAAPRVDLRPLDEKLLLLAGKFKYAVEKGDRNASIAARSALANGIIKVRGRTPTTIQKDKLNSFIQRSAEYLEHWVTYVDISSAVDQIERQTDALHDRLDDEESKLKARSEQLDMRISESASFADAFQRVSRNMLPEDRANWSAEESEAHRLLVDINYCQETVGNARRDLNTKEMEQKSYEQRLKDMQGILSIEPDLDTDDLLNKYDEIMRGWFTELEKIDVAFAEYEQQRQEFRGIREQLEHGAGVTGMRNLAAETARDIQKQKQKDAQQARESASEGSGSNYERAGLPDPEKEREMLEQLEQEREVARESEQTEERRRITE